tara:strand:+ start:564 stop:1010 length:447 start_codon:yes stop_codon:yes gene_type:complete
MATTTAAFTLLSSDIAPSPINKSTTATLTKAGTTTGLQQCDGISRRILLSSETSIVDLISAQAAGATGGAYTVDKANKVYICNSSTSDTDYIIITMYNEEVGRLYAGDWMFFPWGPGHATNSDIRVTAATQTSPVIIDYMVIGQRNEA